MTRVLRLALALFLVPSLVSATPGNQALGLVLHEQACNFVRGMTVFSGSEVETTAQGHAAIVLSTSADKLYLFADSRIKLSGSKDSPVVDVQKGTVRIAVESGSKLNVRALGTLIESVEGRETETEVKVERPNQIVVSALTSSLRVSFGTDSVTVPRGSAYTLELTGPEPQGPQGTGAPAAIRGRGLAVVGGVTIAIVTAIGIYLSNRGSGQGGSVVSPVIP